MVDRYDAFLHKTYIDGNSVKYEDYKALEAKLRETKIMLAAADNGLLKASDPKSGWQGISKECKLWQEKAEALEAKLARLVEAAELKRNVVIRKSPNDRIQLIKNMVGNWIAVPEEDIENLKAAIEAAKVTP